MFLRSAKMFLAAWILTFSTVGGVRGQTILDVNTSIDSITKVTSGIDGSPANGDSFLIGSARSASGGISGDGLIIVFESSANNLVNGDTNDKSDIFAYDRESQELGRISNALDDSESDGTSRDSSISSDGRYIAFSSNATNLIKNDTNRASDVFVYDRQTYEMTRASVKSGGSESGKPASSPALSGDGNVVAFVSVGEDLVDDDTNLRWDVFVHDRRSGETTRVSVASDGSQADDGSRLPAISGDGRFITFSSDATNLVGVGNDTNDVEDVFVHDRQTEETTRVSVATNGTQANGSSVVSDISSDGRYVVFQSSADNLVLEQSIGHRQVYMHDRQTGSTTLVSKNAEGVAANQDSVYPVISDDGRYVVFMSRASNLVDDSPAGNSWKVFLYDIHTEVTELVSSAHDDMPLDGDSNGGHAVSANGRAVAFASAATNLVSDDTNGQFDIFLYDRDEIISAQGGISGRILDDRGNPVPAVRIELNTGLEAVSDAHGNYAFAALRPGTYTIAPAPDNITMYSPASREVILRSRDEKKTDIGFLQRPVPQPFLDQPVFPNTAFIDLIQPAGGTNTSGTLVSWFDHKYPTYRVDYDDLLWRWDGVVAQDILDVRCKNGVNCYDGHSGIDFDDLGTASAYAAASGVVHEIHDQDDNDYGKYVIIDHLNGYATRYAHLESIVRDLQARSDISANDEIGVIGNTGNSDDGSHLHFGVYFDINGDRIWKEAEVVDPFGWCTRYIFCTADPWEIRSGIPSHYLWKTSLSSVMSISPTGGTVTSPSGKISVEIPEDAVNEPVTFDLLEVPPPSVERIDSDGYKSIGNFFYLRVIEWLTPVASSSSRGQSLNHLLEFTVRHRSIPHFDPQKVTLAVWDQTQGVWLNLDTVRADDNEVRASSDSLGLYTLRGQFLCPIDESEPNDRDTSAVSLDIGRQSELHVFDTIEDEDWFAINLTAHQSYQLQVVGAVTGSISIFAPDGKSEVGVTNNIWTTDSDSTYFIRFSPTSSSVVGCDATYALTVQETGTRSTDIYLPFINR